MKSSPHSPQLQKSPHAATKPNTAKTKKEILKKKKITVTDYNPLNKLINQGFTQI